MQTAAPPLSLRSPDAFAHPARNVAVLGVDIGMSVADFGSGSGAYALLMAEALHGTGHVFAIDVQRELLRRTQHEARRLGLKNVDVVCADLEKPGDSKLADGKLDFVLISNLLFQITDKTAVLREAHRVLKPRGRLGIVDWSESFGGMGPTKRDVVGKDLAMQLASDAGFELQREFPAGAHHYGLILRPIREEV